MMDDEDEPHEDVVRLGGIATLILQEFAPKFEEMGVLLTVVLRAPEAGLVVAASSERNRDAPRMLRALAHQIESGDGCLSLADEDCDS